MLRTLTDRSGGQEDKRRIILDAAVRVFARKGYHSSRVGDIAEEAGVAHGLLYHYFRSKEELLETIFRETWRDVLDAVRAIEETDESARERLAGKRGAVVGRIDVHPERPLPFRRADHLDDRRRHLTDVRPGRLQLGELLTHLRHQTGVLRLVRRDHVGIGR